MCVPHIQSRDVTRAFMLLFFVFFGKFLHLTTNCWIILFIFFAVKIARIDIVIIYERRQKAVKAVVAYNGLEGDDGIYLCTVDVCAGEEKYYILLLKSCWKKKKNLHDDEGYIYME